MIILMGLASFGRQLYQAIKHEDGSVEYNRAPDEAIERMIGNLIAVMRFEAKKLDVPAVFEKAQNPD